MSIIQIKANSFHDLTKKLHLVSLWIAPAFIKDVTVKSNYDDTDFNNVVQTHKAFIEVEKSWSELLPEDIWNCMGEGFWESSFWTSTDILDIDNLDNSDYSKFTVNGRSYSALTFYILTGIKGLSEYHS